MAVPDPGSIHKPLRNIIPGKTPEFLSPEWGAITPFALTEADRNIYGRNGYNYCHHARGRHFRILSDVCLFARAELSHSTLHIFGIDRGLFDCIGSYKNRKSLTIPGGLFWALAALTVAPTLTLIIPVMLRMMFVSPLKTKYKMIHAALLLLIFFDYFSTVDDQAVHLLPGCHAD